MEELKDKNIDYALYPIDGIYNMDAVEATEVANLVGAKNNIPIHEFNSGDERKQENFTPEGRLELLQASHLRGQHRLHKQQPGQKFIHIKKQPQRL